MFWAPKTADSTPDPALGRLMVSGRRQREEVKLKPREDRGRTEGTYDRSEPEKAWLFCTAMGSHGRL